MLPLYRERVQELEIEIHRLRTGHFPDQPTEHWIRDSWIELRQDQIGRYQEWIQIAEELTSKPVLNPKVPNPTGNSNSPKEIVDIF